MHSVQLRFTFTFAITTVPIAIVIVAVVAPVAVIIPVVSTAILVPIAVVTVAVIAPVAVIIPVISTAVLVPIAVISVTTCVSITVVATSIGIVCTIARPLTTALIQELAERVAWVVVIALRIVVAADNGIRSKAFALEAHVLEEVAPTFAALPLIKKLINGCCAFIG